MVIVNNCIYFSVFRHFPPKERVMRTVTMTKCLYAMLIKQKCVPEKRTGWDLVETTDSRYKAQITGIRIVSMINVTFT